MFKQADILAIKLASWDPWRRPQAVFSGCSALVGCRAPNPATDYPEGLACLGGKCRCCRKFNTLLLNVFFCVSRGNDVRCYRYAHIGKRDTADLIGSGFWKIWIKPRYEYSMFCDFVHPFEVKIHWLRWSFPLFMLCIPASGLNDKTYFVQRLSTLCESLYGFVRFPNLRSQTTMTWQLKVGSKYTHQTPLTPRERCQFKSLDE